MDLKLNGETALVVGGSYGIGLETARLLLHEGADVLLASRNPENLAGAAAELEKETGRSVPCLAADVTKAGDVENLAAWVGQRCSALDILISAAGGSQRAAFEDLSDQEWLANYELNVLGTVRVIRAFLPLLRAARNGRIVTLGAASARMPYAHQVVSNVHKAGLLSLTKTLAAELAGDNIRVNAVCPGRTLTPLWINRADKMAAERGVDRDTIIEEFARDIPMKRFGRPEEIAAMVVLLASRRSSYMTGQSINVDGGIARGLL